MGVLLVAYAINISTYRMHSTSLSSLNCIADYTVQSVNIAMSRKVQLQVKLPHNVNGISYTIQVYDSYIVLRAKGLEISKETMFPMKNTILYGGKSYRIFPYQGVAYFQEV